LLVLEDALKATVTALDTAAAAMDTVSLVAFTDEEIEGPDAATAFTAAENKVGACFTAYQLGDWNDEVKLMEAARKLDQELVDQMKVTFSAGKDASIPVIPDSDKVIITIQKDGDAGPITCTISKDTTLNAIVWEVIGEAGIPTIHEWQVQQGDNRESVGFHKLAGDIHAKGTLYLVHKPSPGSNAKPSAKQRKIAPKGKM